MNIYSVKHVWARPTSKQHIIYE